MPVDIASGAVRLSSEDVSILGHVNLVLDRKYNTSLLDEVAGFFGRGWTTKYLSALSRTAEGFEFVTPSGSLELFTDRENTLEQGATLRKLGARFELFSEPRRYVIRQWGDMSGCWRYIFLPGSSVSKMPLASIEDATGRALDLTWQNNTLLLTARQRSEGRELWFEYNSANLLHTVTLVAPNGTNRRVARYEYNTDGQLSAAFDALDFSHRYEYDSQGRLVRELARDGAVFSYRYDNQGRCVWTSGLDRYDEKRLRFLPNIRITEVTDSYKSTRRYQYLATGQVTSEWDPLGAETKTEYDTYGRITARTSPAGGTTRLEYDRFGNLSGITDAAGAAHSTAFNNDHQPTVSEDPLGGIWKREYDAQGRLIRVVNPMGATTAYEYDVNGNRIRTISPTNSITQYRYRPDGTLHQVIEPGGATRSLVFDEFGRPSMTANSMGGAVQTRRDVMARVIEIRKPDGTTMKFEYDVVGNIVARTDGQGNRTKFTWGTCGRLLMRVDPLGRSESYSWGTEPNRLLAVTNENGDSLTLSYDEAGRITEETSFDGRVRKFNYNFAGAQTIITDADESTIQVEYDPLNRLVSRRLQNGFTEQFEFDLLGRLVAARNGDVSVGYEYDPLGNVTLERQGESEVRSVYDPAGRLLRRTTNLGLDVNFTRDPNGHLAGLNFRGDNSYSFTYDRAGSEVARLLPGGVQLVQERDERGRIARQFVGPASRQTADVRLTGFLNASVARSFRYNGNDAPLVINDRRSGDVEYSYDGAQQLLSAEHPAAKRSDRFQYTGTGVLRDVSSINTLQRFVYSSGDRLIRTDDSEYEYDPAGRRIRKAGKSEVWNYSWDGLGRLRSYSAPSGVIWTYRYDAFGRRVSKSGPNGTTRFVWSGDTIIHVISNAGEIESWIFDNNSFVPIAKASQRELYSVITDHLGVPREMLDRDGTIAWAGSLSPWGSNISPTQWRTDCALRFPGQWFDEESGLHYNRHRYYDPAIGQFISQDPIGIDGGLNLYRYAPNPLSYVDPFGLDVCANRQKGEDFKNAVKDELEKAGYTVTDEVTIKVTTGPPPGTVRTRVDLMVIDPSGNPVFIECKASDTAPYTPNQTAAGVPNGTLAGSAEYRTDKGGLQRGSAVPPTATTATVRPGGPIPLTGPPPVTAPTPPPP